MQSLLCRRRKGNSLKEELRSKPLLMMRARLHCRGTTPKAKASMQMQAYAMQSLACTCVYSPPCLTYRRAQHAESAYFELAGVLSQAPDPVPYLHALVSTQKSLAELQRENKRLHLYGKAAESEASSASEAVLKNRELEKQVAELQAQLKEKVHPLRIFYD